MIGTVMEYAVRFVDGYNAAEDQEALIKTMGEDGWEWTGFSSCQRATEITMSNNIPAVATETAGFMIYFRRPVMTPAARETVGQQIRDAVKESVGKGELPPQIAALPRRQRREAVREMKKSSEWPKTGEKPN